MEKGGTQRVVSNLANYLATHHQVTLMTIIDSKQAYPLSDTIKVVDISNRNLSKLRQAIDIVGYLHRDFKRLKKKDTVIFSFLVTTNLMVLLSSFGMGLPIIISERNDPKKDGRSFLVRVATYCLYPFAKKVVFQTKYAMNLFPKMVQKKGVIISNPLSKMAEVNRQESSETKSIVSVGRLIEQKNHKMLINSFSEVSKIFTDYKLIIYGEGPLRASLEKQINTLGLEGRVLLPGVVDDIHEHIVNASIFVLSSNYEGQSNALLEAMSLGLPCITTNCSGIDELIDEDNGVLVDVGNEAMLTGAIIDLLSDRNRRETMGKVATRSLKTLSIDQIIHKWLELV
jgi:glycosyltransferase involved in cell wall biosynthesis